MQDDNVAIANVTEYLKCKMLSVMSNLNTDSDATAIISLSLVDADNLIMGILNPILSAVEKAVLAILLTMHKEDFSKYVYRSGTHSRKFQSESKKLQAH